MYVLIVVLVVAIVLLSGTGILAFYYLKFERRLAEAELEMESERRNKSAQRLVIRNQELYMRSIAALAGKSVAGKSVARKSVAKSKPQHRKYMRSTSGASQRGSKFVEEDIDSKSEVSSAGTLD